MRSEAESDCGVILKPRVAFGSACGHHKSLHVQSPCTIVSCVGKTARFWDAASASSTFMHMCEADVDTCSAVSISTSGKYAAVLQMSHTRDQSADGEGTPNLSQISIYNLKVQKLARTIRPDRLRTCANSNRVIDFGLSGGLNKLLYVIWGPVDLTLTVYRWYSGKAIACARDSGILRAAFEPASDHLLAVSENAVMTFCMLQDSLQKCVMHEGRTHFTCATFSMGFCVVGDSSGMISVFEYGALIGQVNAAGNQELQFRNDNSSAGVGGGCSLVDVFACGRGFVTATKSGIMSMFITGEQNSSSSGPFQLRAQHAVTFSGAACITSLAASATGNYVIMMSNLGDQYMLYLADDDETAQVDVIVGENPFEDKKGAHAGIIVAMHAQDRGSLMTTAGLDHTVRVYDAYTGECIAVHTVIDDITAVALHPIAPLLLVGMHASLCLFEVLLNKFVPVHELGYPKTSPIVVSSTGHQFAAVVGGSFSIIICETLSGEVVARLTGHASPVTGLSWTHDDSVLCSASLDGTVLFWNCQTRQRLQNFEYANNIQQFQSVFAMPQVGCVTVRAQSGLISCVENGDLVMQTSGPAGSMLGSCLLGFGRVLIVGDADGNINSWPWYGKREAVTPSTLPAHSAKLLHLCACAGQSMLVSAAADGTVMVWDLQVIVAGLELPPQWRPPEQPSYKVARPALKHLLLKIRDLGICVLGAEAAARAKAAIQIKELQDTVQRLESEVSSLGQQLDEQEERLGKQRQSLTEQFNSKRRVLETLHMQARVQLETTYEKRLDLERATLRSQLAERDDRQFHIEETLQRMRQNYQDEVLKLREDMADQIDDLKVQCQKLQREGTTAQEEYKQVIQQTEAEFDDNTERMKIQLEHMLAESRQQVEDLNAQIHSYTRDNLRLKGEKLHDTRTMTKQRKQIQDLESKLKTQTDKSMELQGALREHQSVSADKHGIIDQLQDRMSNLHTVSFVMGERAERFSEELQPRREEVAKLTEQRSHQDQELARTLRTVASLKQAINDKQDQLRNMKADAMEARNKSSSSQSLLGQMKGDLAAVMDAPDEALVGRSSKRIVALTAMARKWINCSAVTQKQEESASSDATMRRQLVAVELKAGLADFRASRLHRSSKAQKAQQLAENVQLLQENYNLRRENQGLRQELQCSRAEALQQKPSPTRRIPISQAISSSHTGAMVPEGGNSASVTAKNGGDVQEDDGEDDDFDPALVSLGSRAPPSRPTSSGAQLSAHELSLQNKQRPSSHAERDRSLVGERERPQIAIGLGCTGLRMASRQQRPVSAQSLHNRSLTRSADKVALNGNLGNLIHSQFWMTEGHNVDLQLLQSTPHGQVASYEWVPPKRPRSGHAKPQSHGQHSHPDSKRGHLSTWHVQDEVQGSWSKPRRRPTSAGGVGVQSTRARLTGRTNAKDVV